MAEAASIWELNLYIAGKTPKSSVAYENLKRICDEYLANRCNIKIFDISANPKLTVENQITATPTVIRTKPLPKKVLIGNLANTERVIFKLEIKR